MSEETVPVSDDQKVDDSTNAPSGDLSSAIDKSLRDAVKSASSGTDKGNNADLEGVTAEPPEEPDAATAEAKPEPEAEAKPDVTEPNNEDQAEWTPEQMQRAQEAVILKGLREDPINTVLTLYRLAGLDKQGQPAAEPGASESDDIKAALNEAVGEDIAEKLLPAIDKVVASRVKTEIKPYAAAQEAQIAKLVEDETQRLLTNFTKQHPDWKALEPEMLKVAEKFPASEKVSEMEYMEHLYQTVKAQTARAEARKAETARVNNSAVKAGTNVQGTVSPNAVVSAPPKAKNFDEALERGIRAAFRGEKFAYEDNA